MRATGLWSFPSCRGSSISALNMFSDVAIYLLLIVLETLTALGGLAHSLDEPGPAGVSVIATRLGAAVSFSVPALRTPHGVTIPLQITFVDAHLPYH